MSEYDSPWKETLDQFFAAFLEFCFPQIYVRIDWSVPPKMLDKEFRRSLRTANWGDDRPENRLNGIMESCVYCDCSMIVELTLMYCEDCTV